MEAGGEDKRPRPLEYPLSKLQCLGYAIVPVSSLGFAIILTGVRVNRNIQIQYEVDYVGEPGIFSHMSMMYWEKPEQIGSIMHAVCQTIGSLLGV